jgi:hypothetical protein
MPFEVSGCLIPVPENHCYSDQIFPEIELLKASFKVRESRQADLI